MNHSGLYCPKCGQLNDAEAGFCRHCGAPPPKPGDPPQFFAPAVAPPAVLRPETAWPQADSGSGHGSVPRLDAGTAEPAALADLGDYAGFWIRLLAVIIDGAVISAVLVPVWLVMAGFMGAMASGMRRQGPPDPRRFMMALPLMGVIWGGMLVANWLYDALLTSSSRQGTLGKMVLGLRVTDVRGDRLSFGHATGRFFAKFVNQFTFGIGWLLAGFTARKQGLHDFIAGTYVVRR